MIYQIDGIGTENKGAALMMETILNILDEADLNKSNKYILNSLAINKSLVESKNLDFSIPILNRLLSGTLKRELLSRLKIRAYHQFTDLKPRKKVDVLIDAGGFRFGDQWNYSDDYLKSLRNYYSAYKSIGTKIIFLPQAYGPFETENAKRTMSIVLDYADLIMPRDNTSKKFLEEFAPQKKFITYPDITLSFKSRVRLRSEAPTKRICIIPNRKMYTQTKLDKETYVTKICQVIDHLCAKGEKPFLLNHEGLKDKYLCRDIQKRCNESIALYNNLGGITTKHMIGQSKVVISSRYHGVASALGQGIPCLATSWSHKYEQLYHDFGVEPNMIDLDSDIFHLQQRIDEFLDVLNLTKTKSDLLTGFIDVQNRNIEMWNKVNKLCQRE